MTQLADWLKSYGAALSIIGASITFVVSTILQIIQRRAEAEERQFQAFHRVVESVVSPDPKGGIHYIDRQAAVIFELRHFPRYVDFTERMLARLRKKWVKDQAPHWVEGQAPPDHVLIEEIDLTLKHIENKK
jgi:hypothetical protein